MIESIREQIADIIGEACDITLCSPNVETCAKCRTDRILALLKDRLKLEAVENLYPDKREYILQRGAYADGSETQLEADQSVIDKILKAK